MADENQSSATGRAHVPARPIKYVQDAEGNGWLCDSDVDIDGNLEAQGCWRCGEMAFPNGS